jgi:hypothetical protein
MNRELSKSSEWGPNVALTLARFKEAATKAVFGSYH